ncbi:MAG: hypothetical protein CMJ65_09640 [Planctomycetaceae bacterium]|nr:hypothetical protein [Planctomycetaceae bacterium]MDP7274087.1 DUF1501 domain-containing protein [Planctomycetaceae bacterium]
MTFRRRQLLQAGSLGALGLSLPAVLRSEQRRDSSSRRRAKSCILFFMEGGPSQIDLWDMKPSAPQNVRGPYRPIATSLPGMQLCEHLPLLARQMHHLSVVRSVSHTFVDHNASSYFMLTGQAPLRGSQLIRGSSPSNAPPYGSVLAKLQPTERALPDYVHLPKRMFNCGHFIPGVLAGFLGDTFDPFIAGDPSQSDYRVPGLDKQMGEERFGRRRSLLGLLDRGLDEPRPPRSVTRKDVFYEKAFSLITASEARDAFRLDKESEAVRARYGMRRSVAGVRGGGLPHLGQCLLLARRLVERGVRLVSVWAGGQAFDGHKQHYKSLTDGLCPPVDRGLSALIGDLEDRGMLQDTLVACLSEFGRTPKLGQVTSSAGATSDGRDHWPHCFTALFAGGGIKAGYVHGRSDRLAAYPVADRVTPQDVAATIYTALGVDPRQRIHDQFQRPQTLAEGEPIAALFA